jgi:SDR family mycofactocin-dependent oxidoreductase
VGKLDAKVAFITGAARGQGRAHCIRMAEEGADIIAIDACGPVADNAYDPATPEDLEETVRLVEKTGRRIIATRADVRDFDAMQRVCAEGSAQLGGLHVVVANAGISNWCRFWEMSESQWQTMIDINLTGVWHTLKAAAPIMIEQGKGGSIILVSSVAGLKALPGQAHYSSAKHGLVGLCKAAALELGPYLIRVNTIHPWGVDTHMTQDPPLWALLEQNPTFNNSFGSILPSPEIAQPSDIADAVIWLATDDSKLTTGAQIPLDMGATRV